MSTGVTRRDRDVVFGSRVRPGTVVAARYRALELLGTGGMGQVVLVEHVDLPKRFALKLIRPDRWDETLEARFRREARALARVNSPRVAEVTDFGVDPDLGPFFVMEYVEGATLGALLESEGPLDAGRALELAIGLAEALRDVHAAGIVHRDVKPGNVAIDAGPIEVRLMDFGLAASLGQGVESRITQNHAVVGSMPYMSPEQLGGGAPSLQMDLWALGIVLFEMLHGRLPFEAQSTVALMHQILTQEVPLTPRVGPALEPVFARLLAKDPKERASSADEAIELLEEAAAAPRDQWESSPNAETVEAIRVDTQRPPPPNESGATTARAAKPWWALAIGGAVLVLGLGALSWQLGDDSDEHVEVGSVHTVPLAARAQEDEPREPVSIEDEATAIDEPVAEERPERATRAPIVEAEAPRGATARPERAARRGARGEAAVSGETPPAPAEAELETPTPEGEGDVWTGGIIDTPSE